MPKRRWLAFAALLMCMGMLAGCSRAKRDTKEKAMDVVYRGEVSALGEESITVTQMHGYNYGQPSIVFHLNEETETDGAKLALGAYVEVTYNGILTRSMPGQGTALQVRVIATYSQGILVNGRIQSAETGKDGYRLVVLPFENEKAGEEAGFADSVILNVPSDALEGLEESDLVAGTEVCAVTKGIATMSLPPQMPVYALLPYTS